MFFSNLLENEGIREYVRRERKGVMPFVNTQTENLSESHIAVVNNQIVVTQDPMAEDVFMAGLTGEGEFLKNYGCTLTYSQVADTAENPLIVVLAKSINFYEGVKTFVKFIHISDDAVLACLVYGACEFVFDDGTAVPLQRCNEQNTDNLRKVNFSGKKLHSISSVEDKESGYNMEYDVVHAVIVNIKRSKIEVAMSYRTVKECLYVLTEENVVAHREKIVEMKRAEEQKKKDALAKRANAEYKQKVEKQRQQASAGAAAFMAAVRGI